MGDADGWTVELAQSSRQAMPTGEEMNGILVAVAKGDQQAFTLLFNHFAPRIAAYLMRSGAPPATAEELAQEAMVMLWRKARSFDPARGAVSTWVFAIARHLRIDRHRRDGGEARGLDLDLDLLDLDGHDLADPAPSPDECLSALQRERRVRAAMGLLSPKHALLLQLSFFAECSHPDIARDLCLPLGTVKSHIRRALSKMRRSLEASET